MDYKKQQEYYNAKKKVKEIKGFYTHLVIYCLVMTTIIFVNLRYEPHFHWFWFSLIGWGIGLFIHWFNVFGLRLLGIGEKWEEKKIKELMENQHK